MWSEEIPRNKGINTIKFAIFIELKGSKESEILKCLKKKKN